MRFSASSVGSFGEMMFFIPHNLNESFVNTDFKKITSDQVTAISLIIKGNGGHWSLVTFYMIKKTHFLKKQKRIVDNKYIHYSFSSI